MAWFPNVPAANQFISASQPEIQQNFQELNTWSQVDHYPINLAAATNGFHKKVTMPAQAAGAPPAFPATDVGLYAKIPEAPFPLSAVTEMFMHLQNGTEVPITMKSGPTFTASIADSFFYLPSNVLVKMGRLVYQPAPGIGQYGPPAAPEVGRYRYTYTVAADKPVFATNPYVMVFPFLTNGATEVYITPIALIGTTSFEFYYRKVESAALNQVSSYVPAAGSGGVYYIAIGTPV